MNRIATITLALAATLAGCTAPADESAVSVQDDANFDTSGASIAPVESPENLSLRGALLTIDGDAVGGATVCVLGQDACTTSAPDGTFEVAGIEAGIAEIVRIDADGFMPAILPIERDGTRNAAAVAVAQAGGIEIELVPRARFRLADAGYVYSPDSPLRPVNGSTVEHPFEEIPEGAGQICSVSIGWGGPGPNEATLAIFPGTITYVQRDCVTM